MEPHRRKPPRRGIGLRWMLLSVLLPLGNACAEEPAAPNLPATHITSNQSVSIDELEAPPLSETEADGTDVVEPGVIEANASDTAAAPGQAGSETHTIPHPGRSTTPPGAFARPATGADPGGGGVKRATPWYRSGLGALALVLVLIVAVYWLVRRYLPAARAGDSGVLRVVARTGLAPKQSLMLIRLPRRFVLVAVSQNRVDTLCAIDDAEEVADLSARVHAPVAGGGVQFDQLLQTEESEYDEAEVLGAARARGAGQAGSDGLAGLLVKLRTLTSKN